MSHSSFQRKGVHLTGPWFLACKTSLTLVNFDTANARSCTARLTMTVMKQKINLLEGVKKKIVLEERWLNLRYQRA